MVNSIFPTGRLNAPCKGCGDRTPGCHANCPGYAAYRDQVRDLNDSARIEEARDYARYSFDAHVRFTNYAKARHGKGGVRR